MENVGFQCYPVILSGMISFLKWMSILSAADKTYTQLGRKNSRVTGKHEILVRHGIASCTCLFIHTW